MTTFQSQLQTLYRDRNYRQRLLDIEEKRREYQSKKRLFNRTRALLLVPYFIFEFIFLGTLYCLVFLPDSFVAISAIATIGLIVYTIKRGWQEAKSKITDFWKLGKFLLFGFPIEAITGFIESTFPKAHDSASGLMMVFIGLIFLQNDPFYIGLNLSRGNVILGLLIAAVSGGCMYKIFTVCQKLQIQIQPLFQLYTAALMEFRAEALSSLAQIVYPNARDIQFIHNWDFKISNKDSLGVTSSQLFYRQWERYAECNKLTFSINGLTYQVGDVEMIFFMEPSNDATEFQKFAYFNTKQSPKFGVFRGIFYSLPFLKAQRSSIYLIPKTANPIPLENRKKLIKSWTGKPKLVTVQVSRDYPWLELNSRADIGRPDRFIREGFEEYSMESDAIEDRFYTFGKDENATRKLLSYRFMERIVEVVAPQQNEDSSGCDLWFSMQPKQLSIARQRQDLMFFTQTGDRSAEFENVLENFRKLQSILQPIEQLDVVRSNAQKL